MRRKMAGATVHLYFDGKAWRVRSEDATVAARGPYPTYHAADSAAHDLAQELGTDERHHDGGDLMREVCDRPEHAEQAAVVQPPARSASIRDRMKRAVRRLLGRDAHPPRCRLERVGRDPRAALAADKRHWTRTMAEIEQLMRAPTDAALPDEPGEPRIGDPPVSAELSHELEQALRGLPRAGDLTIQFWQTAERDGLAEAFDRLSIALGDSGRDLSGVRDLVHRAQA